MDKADTESIIAEWKLKKRLEVLKVKNLFEQYIEEASQDVLGDFL